MQLVVRAMDSSEQEDAEIAVAQKTIMTKTSPLSSSGTGLAVSDSGIVLEAAHAVSEATTLSGDTIQPVTSGTSNSNGNEGVVGYKYKDYANLKTIDGVNIEELGSKKKKSKNNTEASDTRKLASAAIAQMQMQQQLQQQQQLAAMNSSGMMQQLYSMNNAIAAGGRLLPDAHAMRLQKFPSKLASILSRPEWSSIVTWMPHGRSWKVIKPHDFETLIMPLFFDHSNYHSFNRLVNAWAFRRISTGPDRGSYWHELFLRGRPQLHRLMRRLPKSQKKKPMKKSEEPDFYSMPKMEELPGHALLAQVQAQGALVAQGQAQDAIASTTNSSLSHASGSIANSSPVPVPSQDASNSNINAFANMNNMNMMGAGFDPFSNPDFMHMMSQSMGRGGDEADVSNEMARLAMQQQMDLLISGVQPNHLSGNMQALAMGMNAGNPMNMLQQQIQLQQQIVDMTANTITNGQLQDIHYSHQRLLQQEQHSQDVQGDEQRLQQQGHHSQEIKGDHQNYLLAKSQDFSAGLGQPDHLGMLGHPSSEISGHEETTMNSPAAKTG